MRQGYKPDLNEILAEAFDGEVSTRSQSPTGTCQNPGCSEPSEFRFCSPACRRRGESYRSSLRFKYGLTPAEYNRMLESQGDVCAICGQPPPDNLPRLQVDHDHETGAVRGLLCSPCNKALAGARDNVDILRSMITYLQHHAGVPATLF